MSKVIFMGTNVYCTIVGNDLSDILRDHYGVGTVVRVMALENIDEFDNLEYRINGIPSREVEQVDDCWIFTYHLRT